MTATDYIGSAIARTNNVLAAPIIGSVDTVHLFLTVGIVLVSALVWARVTAHLAKA